MVTFDGSILEWKWEWDLEKEEVELSKWGYLLVMLSSNKFMLMYINAYYIIKCSPCLRCTHQALADDDEDHRHVVTVWRYYLAVFNYTT